MINIIYEDKDILVCHKPAGLAVQTRRIGQPDMESELKNYRVSKGETPYIGIIHRLDQPVEGLIVFAKNQASAAKLSGQVTSRQFAKYYYALVYMPENYQREDHLSAGLQQESRREREVHEEKFQPENSSWITLTDYLLKDGRTNTAQIVSEKAPGAKRAVLEYRIVTCREGIALADIHLHTGRHHQIRVQMAHAGMPLVGDRKYGSRQMDDEARTCRCERTADTASAYEGEPADGAVRIYEETIGKCGLALCAYRLEFVHPISGEKLSFEIEPEWINDRPE